jgi:ABC-2 type transport system ATP-binding protein
MTQTKGKVKNDFYVEIKNLTKKFGEQIAVNNFSLKINNGDCIGLIGPNGAGKTTLLRMVAGILKQNKGEVLSGQKNIEKQKHLLGYLPQYPQFYDWMNAEEVLTFYSKFFGMSNDEIKIRLKETLELVGLVGCEKKKVTDFSGGMKQRLGIAQAVIHKPKFVILDEPVSALDPIGRREVLDLIEKIKQDTTVIFSTHILSDAQEVCNRFCIMKQGEKIDDFYVADLQKNQAKNCLVIELDQKGSNYLSWINYLNKLNFIVKIVEIPNGVYVESEKGKKDWRHLVVKSLLEFNIDFLKIEVEKFLLEDYFMKLVGESIA